MAAIKLKVKQTLVGSISLYKQCFPRLLRVVLPLLIVSQAVDRLSYEFDGVIGYGLAFVSLLFGTLAGIKALQTFFRSEPVPPLNLPAISARLFFFFLVVTVYVEAISFAFGLLFLVPGILLFGSAILAPVLVLENNAGPFEAIGTSVEHAKGNILRISAVLLAIWLPYVLVLISWSVVFIVGGESIATEVLDFALSLVLAMVGLLIPSAAVVLYRALSPGFVTKSGDEAQPPSAPAEA